jgi:serine/threonine-protein kinase
MDSAVNFDIWLNEVERGTMTRLTFTPGMEIEPVWSPDGKHLVFASEGRGGPRNLYWARSDGTGETVRLTNNPENQAPQSFSPDGRRLVFVQSTTSNHNDLWTLPLKNTDSDHPEVAAAEPFLQTPFDETDAALSPDGRWVAYTSNESGKADVYVRPFPEPGGKWPVSAGGGTAPVWSKTERKLFYGTEDGIMVVTYTATGQTFTAGKPQLWFKKPDLGFFELAPDGKRFAVVQSETPAQPGVTQLTVVLNYFSELRRRIDAARAEAQ